jgi:hypothetical protein
MHFLKPFFREVGLRTECRVCACKRERQWRALMDNAETAAGWTAPTGADARWRTELGSGGVPRAAAG